MAPRSRAMTFDDIVSYGEGLIELAIKESLDELRWECCGGPSSRQRRINDPAAAQETSSSKTDAAAPAAVGGGVRGIAALKNQTRDAANSPVASDVRVGVPEPAGPKPAYVRPQPRGSRKAD
eukprot:TRINITY_DN28284_c0_g6_i1.p1 TRINITY_DN28284_c0_g6~~TRINITY_DN28284_c0_g6_i1.p1  ORF type:complete len:122 (+),score=16.48 TRINITY_DN28284_c0_g6_i1:208-573(+)